MEPPSSFCQYYACKDSDELWEGYTALGGSYSIDYMIGETDYLRKGFGKKIVGDLTNRIMLHNDAKKESSYSLSRKTKPPVVYCCPVVLHLIQKRRFM